MSTAFTGHDALSTAHSREHCAVILAIRLPDVDGFEVARQLRNGRDGKGTPLLIALTGFGLEADRAKAREAGFDHHLIKPADPDELIRLLPPSTDGCC